MTEEQTNENKRSWLNLFQENWSWVTPLIYIYVSYVGMVFSWFRFKSFGINIVEFSEINDFLLAAFREPLSLLMVLIIIFTSYLIVLLFQFLEKKSDIPRKNLSSAAAKYYGETSLSAKIKLLLLKPLLFANKFSNTTIFSQSFQKYFVVLYALIAAPLLVSFYYDNRGKGLILNNLSRHMNVVFVDRGNVETCPKTYVLLGTTDNYVFFYDKLEKKATVVPFVNIQQIEHNFSIN